jgi:hypothetical protein
MLRWSDVVVAGVFGALVSASVYACATEDATPPVPTPVTRVVVVPVAPVAPHIVYVPAGPAVFPEEDSCRVDFDGERWVVIPGGDR